MFVTGRHRQNTLHVVAQSDDVEMLEVLHEVACARGIKEDIVARDSNGVSIVHVAAKAGALRVMTFLFKAYSMTHFVRMWFHFAIPDVVVEEE